MKPTFLLIIAFIVICLSNVSAQTNFGYWGADEHGDSVYYKVFPRDTGYVPKEIIIKFRAGVLNKDLLCYDCYGGWFAAHSQSPNALIQPPTMSECWSAMMAQSFAVDSGIINDYTLASTIKYFGDRRLRRMTFANPCYDTLSVTRYGDTIPMDHFNYMVLTVNHDSNVVRVITTLLIYFRNKVQYAEPNNLLYGARRPHESVYGNGSQKSMSLCGADSAWNHQTGNPAIKVAVIDNGINFHRKELGGTDSTGFGPGFKVANGWNYTNNTWDCSALNNTLALNCQHGTSCASVIGANTNRIFNGAAEIVGVAGGWGNAGADTADMKAGVTLYGLRVTNPTATNELDYRIDYISSAIFLAGTSSATVVTNPFDSTKSRYGFGVNAINNSYAKSGKRVILYRVNIFPYEKPLKRHIKTGLHLLRQKTISMV